MSVKLGETVSREVVLGKFQIRCIQKYNFCKTNVEWITYLKLQNYMTQTCT
jgi:hypothetical protein